MFRLDCVVKNTPFAVPVWCQCDLSQTSPTPASNHPSPQWPINLPSSTFNCQDAGRHREGFRSRWSDCARVVRVTFCGGNEEGWRNEYAGGNAKERSTLEGISCFKVCCVGGDKHRYIGL
jgi:hypothetical protein